MDSTKMTSFQVNFNLGESKKITRPNVNKEAGEPQGIPLFVENWSMEMVVWQGATYTTIERSCL